MKVETSTIAAKSAATGAAAAFGLTWWAVGFALVGALFATLHFDKERPPERIVGTALGILALAFVAACIASAAPNVPGFAWTDGVPVEIRAGLAGVFANPLISLIKWLIAARKATGAN